MFINTLSRRLVLLQGDEQAIITQLSYLNHRVKGDWIVISNDESLITSLNQYTVNQHPKSLLGGEFKHAIFDARLGFNLETLAILTGTLVAESLLILILPEYFQHWHDQDSLRWCETVSPILVPNFVAHLQKVIQRQQQYCETIYPLSVDHHQEQRYLFDLFFQGDLPQSQPLTWHNYQEQQDLLNNLVDLKVKIMLLTAKRGRGKSALAGQFAHSHRCWVTAPNKSAVRSVMQFAPPETPFFAPDELLQQLQTTHQQADWLIIDEAAMIPLGIIAKLIAGFKYVLLTTTIDGYEGTGQGLLLKLINQYPKNDVAHFQLHTPIRWINGDPLEYFIDQLMVAQLSPPAINHSSYLSATQLDNPLLFRELTQAELIASPTKLEVVFGLLKSAHYRTTLIDLRRLLDAQNLSLYSAEFKQQDANKQYSDKQEIAGLLVAVEEGGLDQVLVLQILNGYRRPKGNLVAQSLVAHGGESEAALLRSIRINRIAVSQPLRRQNIARRLLAQIINKAQEQQRDFISASFAYSTEMYQFWTQCGFEVIHVGTHKEASSGSYAIMVIYPISSAGVALCRKMQNRVSRNWYWLRQIITIDLPIAVTPEQSINSADKAELTLFATTAYAYSASFSVLMRLVNHLQQQSASLLSILPILTTLVEYQFNENQTITKMKFSGKNELLIRLRQEIYHFIKVQGWINE